MRLLPRSKHLLAVKAWSPKLDTGMHIYRNGGESMKASSDLPTVTVARVFTHTHKRARERSDTHITQIP